MNLRIITKNHAVDPEIGFLTKSISKPNSYATAMPRAWELTVPSLSSLGKVTFLQKSQTSKKNFILQLVFYIPASFAVWNKKISRSLKIAFKVKFLRFPIKHPEVGVSLSQAAF